MSVPIEVFSRKLTFKLGEGAAGVPRWVYVALVKGEKNCLIDTGTSGNFAEIVAFCEEHEVGVDDIDLIINTHCHPDHIGGNLLFKQASPRISLGAHVLAVPSIENIDQQFRRRHVPGFYRLITGSTKVDWPLEEADRLDIGTEVIVLHTPGHSEGSISLFIPELDLLIIGDAIPGRSDVPIYEDVGALRSTINRLEKVGAGRVISAFDGECGPIGEVARLGRGVLERVEEGLAEFLGGLPKGRDEGGQIDLERACRFVLDHMGFSGVATLPIMTASIAAHLHRR